MLCSKCGKEIPDKSKYCKFCGAKVVLQNTNTQEPTKVVESSIPTPTVAVVTESTNTETASHQTAEAQTAQNQSQFTKNEATATVTSTGDSEALKKKVSVAAIVGFIPSILGLIYPIFSLIGIACFIYGIILANNYDKKGKALCIIGIVIAACNGFTGLFISKEIMPLIRSANSLINDVNSTVNNVNNVLGDIHQGAGLILKLFK